jgi:hypothetical protein
MGGGSAQLDASMPMELKVRGLNPRANKNFLKRYLEHSGLKLWLVTVYDQIINMITTHGSLANSN